MFHNILFILKIFISKFIRQILLSKTRYEGGIDCLNSTREQVKIMQETLKELQPMLIIAAQDVQQILASVEKESIEVADVEKVVKIDEEAAMVHKKKDIISSKSFFNPILNLYNGIYVYEFFRKLQLLRKK